MTARIVVLASGRGTNLQVLIDACAGGALRGKAAIVAVISHTPTALALERAKRHGIPATFVAPPGKRAAVDEKAAWELALADRIAAAEPDLIVLAGWMRILGAGFIARFPDPLDPSRARILNLHPAPPGELPGTDAIARAYEEHEQGKRMASGVMVHVVVPEVDAGPVVAFEPLPIAEGMSFEAFEEAMHALEHRLIARAVLGYVDRIRS